MAARGIIKHATSDTLGSPRIETWEWLMALFLVVRGGFILFAGTLHSSPAYAPFLVEGEAFWGVASSATGLAWLAALVAEYAGVASGNHTLWRRGRRVRLCCVAWAFLLMFVSAGYFMTGAWRSMAWVVWAFLTVYVGLTLSRLWPNQDRYA
ncbi:MAG: hypothetical protein AAGI08_03940 [Bacteroidota bacterium]